MEPRPRVLAFIVFYIPDFLRTTGDATRRRATRSRRSRARRSPPATFRRTYQAQLQAYQRAYGGSMNEQLLKQLGIDQQILQQMVDERAALAEAERLGIAVSATRKSASASRRFPRSSRTAQFIGERATSSCCRCSGRRSRRGVRRQPAPRARSSRSCARRVTDWISVTDKELEQEYRAAQRQGEARARQLHRRQVPRPGATPPTPTCTTYFDAAQGANSGFGEKRKIRYLLVDVDALKAQDRRAARRRRTPLQRRTSSRSSTPEQVRASHILLKTEGKDDAAVKAKAEDAAEAGAAPAPTSPSSRRRTPRTKASAKNGGDLDYFGRGQDGAGVRQTSRSRMQPGTDQRSREDAVRVPHHQGGGQEGGRPRARSTEVAQQIADQLAYERAQAQATQIAQYARQADQDGQRSRRGRGGTRPEGAGVGLLLARRADHGHSVRHRNITERAFTLAVNAVDGPMRVARGQVFFTTVGSEPSRLPTLAEVKEKVHDDVRAGRRRT